MPFSLIAAIMLYITCRCTAR